MVLGPGHAGDLIPQVLQEHVCVATVAGGAEQVWSLHQAVQPGLAGASEVRVENCLKNRQDELV